MNQANVMKLLGMLNAEKIKVGTTGWVYSCCPLARWTHSGGTDSRPSFAIRVDDNDKSGYKCHGCQAHGSLDDFTWKYNKFCKWSRHDLINFVSDNDQLSVSALTKMIEGGQNNWSKGFRQVAGVQVSPADFSRIKELEVDDTMPEENLKKISGPIPTGVMQYLTWDRIPRSEQTGDLNPRGLKEETLNKFEVGWDASYKRILMPVRDASGRLVGVTGRSFFKYTNPKFFHYPGFQKSRYLYGEYQSKKDGIGYLVEGHFDVMMLHQMGYPQAVAVMGSHLSDTQVMKICKFFKEVVYIRDGDTPGKEAEDRIKGILHGHIKMSAIEVPDGYDPDELTSEELEKLLGKPEPKQA